MPAPGTLSVVSLTIIFSQPEGCLLILFIVSFAVQKFLSLTRSHMFIFGIHYLGDGSKNIAVTYVKNVSFSSWSFRVSSFMFKSLIHFEFSFVYGDREYSNFTL